MSDELDNKASDVSQERPSEADPKSRIAEGLTKMARRSSSVSGGKKSSQELHRDKLLLEIKTLKMKSKFSRIEIYGKAIGSVIAIALAIRYLVPVIQIQDVELRRVNAALEVARKDLKANTDSLTNRIEALKSETKKSADSSKAHFEELYKKHKATEKEKRLYGQELARLEKEAAYREKFMKTLDELVENLQLRLSNAERALNGK